jgi:hypothetical protein
MYYFENIKSNLKNHITFLEELENIGENLKVKNHLIESRKVYEELSVESPEKLKTIIEFLSNESRNFGWSFPENEMEQNSETSFLKLQSSIERMISGMTLTERLLYFGFQEEYQKLETKHKSARDTILVKLFVN